MKKETQEYLDTIEVVDTSETLKRLEEIKQEAREQVRIENERTVANGTVNQN